MRKIQFYEPSEADKIANLSAQIANNMVKGWISGFLTLWGKPYRPLPDDAPDELKLERDKHEQRRLERSAHILQQLGTRAAGVMEDSKDLLEFILPRLPEKKTMGIISQEEVNELLGFKPDLVIHEDGTVTLE